MKKITRRDTLKLGVAVTAGLLGAGITRSKAADPIVMKLATDVPLGHPFNIGFQAWAEQIESGTEGRVKATIYPDAQLGGEEDMTNGLKIGAVDGMFSSPELIRRMFRKSASSIFPFYFAT